MVKKAKKVPFAKVRGLRAERKISQADMAKVLGISESSYSSRENGKREWMISEMFTMSDYFKLPMDDIFVR